MWSLRISGMSFAGDDFDAITDAIADHADSIQPVADRDQYVITGSGDAPAVLVKHALS